MNIEYSSTSKTKIMIFSRDSVFKVLKALHDNRKNCLTPSLKVLKALHVSRKDCLTPSLKY